MPLPRSLDEPARADTEDSSLTPRSQVVGCPKYCFFQSHRKRKQGALWETMGEFDPRNIGSPPVPSKFFTSVGRSQRLASTTVHVYLLHMISERFCGRTLRPGYQNTYPRGKQLPPPKTLTPRGQVKPWFVRIFECSRFLMFGLRLFGTLLFKARSPPPRLGDFRKTLFASKHRFLSSEQGLETRDESLSRVAKCILEGDAKRIIVLAGAGISTASGIPDFRTPGSGLYDNLSEYNLPYPEAVFDLDYFYSDPAPFYRLAKELYPSGRYKPNIAHYFIRLLHEKSRLLRVYTQNIDSLERIAGIPEKKLVEAHGTFLKATCTVCLSKAPAEDVKKAVDTSTVPKCKKCGGVIKPDIVFFGENLPVRFWKYKIDLLNTDLVFIMGTSLEVYPFAGIADDVSKSIPRVLFNRDLVGTFRHRTRPLDIVVLGSVTESIERLAKFLAWDNELNELMDECGASKPADLNPDEGGKNTKCSSRKPTSNANNGSRHYSTATDSSQLNISQLEKRLRNLPMSDAISVSRSRSTGFSAPRSMSTEPAITSHRDKVPVESISVRRLTVKPRTTSAGEQIASVSVRPVRKSRTKNLKPQPKNALALFRELLNSPTPSDSDTSSSLWSDLPSPDLEGKKHS